MTKQRKLEIFDACVLSKLRYGIASAGLLKADLRRLDGFQARCLRTMLGIKHSYISRICNKEVLARAGQALFTKQLLKQQLKLFRKISCLSDEHFLRELTFCPGSLRAATDRYVRKRGRPRNEWATKLHSEAAALALRHPALPLDQFLTNKLEFERRLNMYIHM